MKSFRSLLRVLCCLLYAIGGASISGAQTLPVRIMPLGDSLTSGTTVQGAYRNKLYSLLTDAGYNVDFVGTQADSNNPTLPDRDHQGMGGYRIDQLQAGIPTWLGATADPDVILLMIGTNDFSANFNVSTAQNRLAGLVADLAAKRPFSKIVVSNLPLRTDNAGLEALQSSFNANVPVIVSNLAAQGVQVSFLDMHSVLVPGDFEEGVHPSVAGYEKMAGAWFPAITGVITPSGTSNPPAIVRTGPPVDLQHIAVTFSKPLADSSANPANFSINGGLPVSQASLDSSKRVITLTTGPQSPGTLYRLSVSGVRDRTPQQNPIPSGSSVNYAAEALANGSFESGQSGWSMSGSYLVFDTTDPYIASDGSAMLVMNGAQTLPSAVISQTFSTIPGQTYVLDYEVGVLALNAASQTLGVELTGASPLLTKSDTVFGNSLGNSVWTPKSLTFVADSATTTLTFRDLSLTGDGLDLLLDHVRVTAIPGNLLANGSFEQGETGWTFTGNRVVYAAQPPYTSLDGESILVMNGGQTPPDAVISQSFSTVPGEAYQIDFNLGTYAVNAAGQVLGVELSGASSLLTRSEILFGGSLGTSQWTARSYRFIADNTTTTLTFRDLSDTSNGVDLMLENVRVVRTDTPVSINTAPVAVADSYSTPQGTALVVPAPGVLGNDSDAQGNSLTAVLNAGPAHGNLSLNPNGGFTYTPVTGYTGPDSFTYHANDGSLDSNIVTVALTVNVVNTAPVAVADAYSTNQGVALVVPASGVLGNDTDAQGNSLTAVLNAGPAHGNLSLNPNGGFTYTPVTGYTGPDSFTYHANDGSLDSNIVSVALTVNVVNTAPVAVADSYSTNQGVALVVPASGVLGNDSDAQGDSLTAVLNVGPAHGNLTLNPNGGFTYTPVTGYTGPDSFTYHANDGSLDSNIVTVALTVNVVNTAPVAVSDSYSTNQGVALVVPASGVLGNDSDAQGNSLTAVLNVGPAHGNLTLNPNGGFTYTPVTGYTGPDSFTYHANDGSLDSNVVTVGLTVNVVNTAPVAVADSYSTNLDTALVVPASGVLGNDSDAQGNALTAVLNAGPAHGNLNLNSNGGFTYTPATGYAGSDSFTYHANDGSLDSNVVTVSISIAAPVSEVLVNGSFESNFNAWTATGNQSIEFYRGTQGTRLVAFNSRDLTPNGVLSQTFATIPGSTYTLTFDAGILSYVKKQQKIQATISGAGSILSPTITLNGSGTGAIQWTANRYTFVANSATTTLTFRDRSSSTVGLDLLLDNVHVNGPPAFANSAPVAVADSYSVNRDTLLNVPTTGVLANDVDAPASALTAVLETAPAHGTLNLLANGGFTYLPANGYSGPDSFTYHANDGGLDSNTVTVSISVVDVLPGLIANPSFESDFTSWTKSGNQTIEYYSPTDGIKVVAFNSQNLAPNAVLSQTFATVPGQTYSLGFDAGTIAYNGASQTLEVSVNGTASLLSRTINLIGAGGGLVSWLPQAFTFTADSASTTLSFRDRSTSTVGIDLLLDDVRVLAVTSSTIIPPQPVVDVPQNLGAPAFSMTPAETVVGMIATGNGTYTLQSSEDLVTWRDIETMKCAAQEPVEFHVTRDPLSNEPPKLKLFYRIGYVAEPATD